jgi:hypothetical protein
MGRPHKILARDLCRAAGAQALRGELERYWAKRGARVLFVVVPVKTSDRSVRCHEGEFIPGGVWGIRSDLVNGWPKVTGRLPQHYAKESA